MSERKAVNLESAVRNRTYQQQIEDENQALRDEVARLRGALTAISAAWNTLSHDQSAGGFHAWYSAHIELVEAALTPQHATHDQEAG